TGVNIWALSILFYSSRRRHTIFSRHWSSDVCSSDLERQRLHRGAQRGQRVLEFVSDVGGETLDRLDAAVKRVGHVAQRAGKVAEDRNERRVGKEWRWWRGAVF